MAEALVAGAIVSSIFNVLFERLASQQVVDFFKHKKLDQRLLDKLKTRMNAVSVLLDDAEEKQITSIAVKKWLDDLKDAAYQADDFLDMIAYKAYKELTLQQGPKTCLYQVRSFLSSLSFCEKGMKRMEAELNEIFERLEDLLQQTHTLGLVARVGVRPPPSQGRVTTSLVDDSSVYGRDADKEVIVNVLLSDEATGKNLGVVPIVGMGGVGKTTLAQLVYNDSRVKHRFDKLRAWICVSEEFDVFKLTKAILKEFGSSNSDSMSLNQLQLELEQKLKGERVLVVLDDVWNETYADWELLLAPLRSAARGSKVLVTTRNESVASGMSTVQSHHLQALSDDDCWLLFSKLAFDGCSHDVYGDLEGIGSSIVRKCKGLPLAAKALGGLLRSKRDAKGWEMILKSNMWDLPSDNIIPALRLSYHYLPPHLKQCFAYCAMFPKDFIFSKKDMVLLWMAEGFIVQSDIMRELEDVGEEYFEELTSRSFFQRYHVKDATDFVMHDLINDLAKSIAGEFCYNAEDADLGKFSKRTRHLCCKAYRVDEDLKEGIIRAEFLRTFIGSSNIHLGRHLLSFLSGRLRVLDLFCPEADRLIHLLGSFKYLRFLRLHSVQIKELPEDVSTLYYLQTLILDFHGGSSSIGSLRNLGSKHEPLFVLPESIGDLKELRHLNLNRTKIKLLPDSIGNLKNLKYLTLERTRLKLLPDSIGSLRDLRHLNLYRASVELLPDSIGNLKGLKYLNLGCTSIGRLPESICGLYSLQDLLLYECTKITELPAKITDLANLCHLHIGGTRLESMPPHMGRLTNLQTLSNFIVGKDRETSIREVGELRHLRGCLSINDLQNVADAEDGLEAKLKDKRGLKQLDYSWAENGEADDCGSVHRSLLRNLQPPESIEAITVKRYKGRDFPGWVGDSSFSSIVTLSLRDCKYCDCLPPLGQLASLQRLSLTEFDSIVSVGAEFYGNSKSIQPFRSLLTLEFWRMSRWQEWTWHEKETQQDGFKVFPVLQRLSICYCPKIEMCLRPGILPSTLQALHISNCRLLEQRCQREQGDDWPKICHIPDIFIHHSKI